MCILSIIGVCVCVCADKVYTYLGYINTAVGHDQHLFYSGGEGGGGGLPVTDISSSHQFYGRHIAIGQAEWPMQLASSST